MLSEAFDFPLFGNTPTIPPQFVFLGQKLQGLFALGSTRGLRDIIENRNPESYKETVESLKPIDNIPVLLRRLKDFMMCQLWRL